MTATDDRTRLGRYSRDFYGALADEAEVALAEIVDGGWGRKVDDDLRWLVFTAIRAADDHRAPTPTPPTTAPREDDR